MSERFHPQFMLDDPRVKPALRGLHTLDSIIIAPQQTDVSVMPYMTLTPANILWSLINAHEARESAYSWRRMCVGAYLLGVNVCNRTVRLAAGANYKPDEEKGPDKPNIHAEQLGAMTLEKDGFRIITSVGVVGDFQPDEAGSPDMKTLAPCWLCMEALIASGYIDPEKMLVATALPDFSIVELFSLAGLRRVRQAPASEKSKVHAKNIQTFEYGRTLGIFQPVPLPADGKPLNLLSLECEGEDIYDATIGDFVNWWRLTKCR